MTFDFVKHIHKIRKKKKEKHLKKMGNLQLLEDKKILFLQEKYQKDMMLIDKTLKEIQELTEFDQKRKKFMNMLNCIGME